MNMTMRLTSLIFGLAFLLSGSLYAQDSEAPFYYYMIGHWRSGPEVLITPPMVGDESKTMDQLKDVAIAAFRELKGISDMDVVVEPDLETARKSIDILRQKYARRELSSRVLETGKTEGK